MAVPLLFWPVWVTVGLVQEAPAPSRVSVNRPEEAQRATASVQAELEWSPSDLALQLEAKRLRLQSKRAEVLQLEAEVQALEADVMKSRKVEGTSAVVELAVAVGASGQQLEGKPEISQPVGGRFFLAWLGRLQTQVPADVSARLVFIRCGGIRKT